MSADRPIRVLHVDDDPTITDLAATYLEREGLAVESETSARDGLDRLAGNRSFDCIVSDYDMPETDGLEFLRSVREDHPDLPFVLFTGEGSEEIASAAISAGVTDYLRKGTGAGQYEVLANRVSNNAERYRTERALERSGERYRQLVETSPAPIVICGADGRVAYANEAAAEFVGADNVEAVVGRQALAFVHPDDAEAVSARLETVFDDRERLSPIDRRFVDLDGETRHATVATAPLTFEGEPAAQVVFSDVTDLKGVERALRREREFVERALDTLDDVFYVVDESGSFVRWNDRLSEVSGYTDAEIGSRTALDFFEGPSSKRIAGAISEILETGNSIAEAEITTKAGETIPYEFRGVRLTDDDGDVFGICGIARDIGERRARERELERHETIVETTPVGVFVLDAEGVIVSGNEAAWSITGHGDELIGEPFLTLVEEGRVAPEAIEDYFDVVRDLLSSDNDRTRGSYEATITPPDGDERTYLVSVSLLPFDEEFQGTVAVAEDVTERKRREKRLNALHEATRELMTAATADEAAAITSEAARDVLDLSINAVYFSTEGGLVPAVSTQAATDLFGEVPEIARGEGLLWETFERGETQVHADVRTVGPLKNPETPVRSELMVPLGEHGAFVAASTAVDDLDESDVSLAKVLAANAEAAFDRAERERLLRERTADLERQNERLDEFVSVVSHDLRNPLNVVQGHLALARETGDADHFDAIERGADRMGDLLEDLLALARQGTVVDEPEPVRLAEVAADAWAAVETGSATLTLEDDLGRIDADRTRLQELFANLFRNSVEHGSTSSRHPVDDSVEHGFADSQAQPHDSVEAGGEGVSVTVTVDSSEAGFFVADNGPGIAAADREAVFEHGVTSTTDGTGFGLAIVETIAEAHGWTISVTESETGGARFDVER